MNSLPKDGAFTVNDLPYPIRLLDLFDLAPVGMAILDEELRCVRCNEILAASYGSPPQSLCGRTVRELIPDLADEAEVVYHGVLDTGRPAHNVRVERVSPSGKRLSWLQNVVPLPTGEDGRRFIMVSVQEVTRIDAAERALREMEMRLHTYQQISTDGFTILLAVRNEEGQVVDFMWEFVNPAAERMANVGPLVGKRLSEEIPGSREHPDLLPRYLRLLESGESDTSELLYEEENARGWWRNQATALGTDRIAVCWRNISPRKKAEEELKLVSGEYRHRIKNLLTIVSSLISHASRSSGDANALAETIQRQIQALAAAQDLIGHEPRMPVDLGELVSRTLRPFEETALVMEGGPTVGLPQRLAVPIVLALHELATNALKHGGLSLRGGTVTVGWSEDDGRVTVRWSENLETGSRRSIAGNAPDGFGSRLFAMVERSLPNGKMDLDWRAEGLLALISFDADDDSG